MTCDLAAQIRSRISASPSQVESFRSQVSRFWDSSQTRVKVKTRVSLLQP